MNVIKTILLVAIFTLGFTSVKAQTKIAHINTEALVAVMPATKTLQAKLEKLGKTYDNEMKTKEAEFKAKLEKYNQEAPSQTEETNMARQKEVQLDAQKIEQFKAEAMRDLQSQEQEGLKPILESAQAAIDAVAAAQGFDYVLNEAMLIVKKGKDLLPDVKAKLGIQ